MKHYKEFYDLHLNLRPVTSETEPTQKHLTVFELIRQNIRYAGTAGISRNNRGARFLPAYQDTVTGHVALSCFEDGRPAPIHILDGIPPEWVEARSRDGKILRLKQNVVAGFVRDDVFYTREEVVKQLSH